MAECSPPMFDMHPMRVLFMIPKMQPPTLAASDKWSSEIKDFLASCLVKDPEKRPTAVQLLQHPFVAMKPNANAIIVDLVERARISKRSRQGSVASAYSDAGDFDPNDLSSEEDIDKGSQDGENDNSAADYNTMKKLASTANMTGSSTITSANPHVRTESSTSSIGSMLRPVTAVSVFKSTDVEEATNEVKNMTIKQNPAVIAVKAFSQDELSQRPTTAISANSQANLPKFTAPAPFTQTESQENIKAPRKSPFAGSQGNVTASKTESPVGSQDLLTRQGAAPPLPPSRGSQNALNSSNNSIAASPLNPQLNISKKSTELLHPISSVTSPVENSLATASAPKNRIPGIVQATQPIRVSTASTVNTPASVHVAVSRTLSPFKASRLCRLGRKINCAEYLSDTLILGLDEGLFAMEVDKSAIQGGAPVSVKMAPLSTRKYVQLDFIDDPTRILISSSGKQNSTCLHDLKVLASAPPGAVVKMRKFEEDTSVKKMKEASGCDFVVVSRVRSDVYICFGRGKGALVMKWAPQPLWKFMKVKDYSLDCRPLSLDVIDSAKYDARLFIGTENKGFKVSEMTSGAVESVKYLPEYGTPVKVVDVGGGSGLIVLCYSNVGILTYSDTAGEEVLKKFVWRQAPLTFASTLLAVHTNTHGHLSEEINQSSSSGSGINSHGVPPVLLVAGSTTTVDIWSLETGKIVHIFETKKDRIRKLDFLLVKSGYKLLLLADEEKDGQPCSSIITIMQDGAEKAMEDLATRKRPTASHGSLAAGGGSSGQV